MKPSSEICGIVFDSLEQASEAVVITDAKGLIVYSNRAFERFSGITAQEALGRSAAILKSAGHTDEFYSRILETVSAGKPWTGRVLDRKKDGTGRVLSVRIRPARKEKGGVTHYVAFGRDITAEDALRERLTRDRKLDSMGMLAGQLAHDFNNLLTIIIGSMEMIMEGIPAQSVSMKLAQGILQASKESAGLIKQLLIFARQQECSPEAVRLNEAIAEAKTALERLPGPAHKLEYSLEPGLGRVKLEPEQFRQALANLVVNARDAMPNGGTIRIAAHNQRVERDDPRGIKAGDYAVIEISDTGPGIRPEAMERLFEPFYTTKPKGKGSGLGLAAVYGIVKQHKGELIAESRPGLGAVFRIYLEKAA